MLKGLPEAVVSLWRACECCAQLAWTLKCRGREGSGGSAAQDHVTPWTLARSAPVPD